MATKAKPKRPRTKPHDLRLDDGTAFIPDVMRTGAYVEDDEAEAFAEELITAITSAEYVAEDARDETIVDEVGGPFLETVADVPARAYATTLEDVLDGSPEREA